IGIDSLGVAKQLGSAFGVLLVRGLGQRDELLLVQRATDALVTRIAGCAQSGSAVGMNVLAQSLPPFWRSDNISSLSMLRGSLSSCLNFDLGQRGGQRSRPEIARE